MSTVGALPQLDLDIGTASVRTLQDVQAVLALLGHGDRRSLLAEQLKQPKDRHRAKQWLREVAWQIQHGRDLRTRKKWVVAHTLIAEALRRGSKQPVPLDRVPSGRTR